MAVNKVDLIENIPQVVINAVLSAEKIIDTRLKQEYYKGGFVRFKLSDFEISLFAPEMEMIFVKEIQNIFQGKGWIVSFYQTNADGPAKIVFS